MCLLALQACVWQGSVEFSEEGYNPGTLRRTPGAKATDWAKLTLKHGSAGSK